MRHPPGWTRTRSPRFARGARVVVLNNRRTADVLYESRSRRGWWRIRYHDSGLVAWRPEHLMEGER
jgi:hypothetical protein